MFIGIGYILKCTCMFIGIGYILKYTCMFIGIGYILKCTCMFTQIRLIIMDLVQNVEFKLTKIALGSKTMHLKGLFSISSPS